MPPPMFSFTIEAVEPDQVAKYRVSSEGSPLSYEAVIKLWESNREFRKFYSRILSNSPFLAFRWETPPLTRATSTRPFEFVLINSPEFCSRLPDAHVFNEYFDNDESDSGIVKFPNLGGDSTMIVPSPRTSEKVYGHFAEFIRGAPTSQVDALWHEVGALAQSRLSSEPVWINTAGGGVAWLHVRIDSRPKYYGYKPYRQAV